ncbi:MAG: ABC transporter ATP-binding protein [Gammaproteobacteria bacterium]|nr:ABC transporter ATP-binding protein [Gammaproteobacteria bacterium]
MTKPLIDIHNLVKFYSVAGTKTPVLKHISLAVNKGELVAIMGASGSGKSTLMNLIGLLDKSDGGDYWFNQKNILSYSQDELAVLRNQGIGFVFQQFHLLPRFTAKDNVVLPLLYRNLTKQQRDYRVEQALERVNMSRFALHTPLQLSGGQQQRIAIARALVGEPTVILADEPTGALDSTTGSEVMSLFKELHTEGRTIIVVTHDKSIAAQCERQVHMADGQILAEYSQ